jgi:hypothetical protein
LRVHGAVRFRHRDHIPPGGQRVQRDTGLAQLLDTGREYVVVEDDEGVGAFRPGLAQGLDEAQLAAAAGPLLAAFAMSAVGPAGFFLFAGGVSAAAALYTGYRKLRRAPAAQADRTEFVAVSRATPVGAMLDPRTPRQPETKGKAKKS